MTDTPAPPPASIAAPQPDQDEAADWAAAWDLAAAQQTDPLPSPPIAPPPMAEAEAMREALAGLTGEAKTLSQEEIDRLLNFAAPEGGGPAMSAIQRLVSSTTVNKDRLPMLDVVFDRMVRMLNTSLRQFASTNVEASLSKIEWLRYTDFQDAIELPALIGVARAEPWDNQMLVTIDSALIYCMMDVLLGGRRSRPGRIDGRAYTSIERKMTERMMKVVLQDLGQSFDPLAQVDFVFDRLEVNPQFATITRATNAIIRVRIAVEVERRTGHIDIVIPYATLEPIRGKLVQMFMGEKFGHDT
ncbi:flagellar motor switch protein FliM, partial [Azospirillum sp. B506]|uniref:flagellar motor switch protein FliM n=1 Tax=Azospirillum sp. B506 TaxID=137721 RepID=UPI0006791C32